MSVQTVVSLSQVTDSELTSRELDVLRLLAKGCGNQAIAEKLFVSVTTIKTHLRNINAKLGAHNRTEAISIARTRSIID
jgi:LuxR family transcriptional regulator, maltose regulon positive regulatory protein